jgi:hypothetical protein
VGTIAPGGCDGIGSLGAAKESDVGYNSIDADVRVSARGTNALLRMSPTTNVRIMCLLIMFLFKA